MTTRLLTMAALAWASSAMAGNWDAPVAPSDADAAVIEIGGHYYATPKGTGQFLRGSNSWGTQASLDKEGYEVIIKDTVDVKGNPGWGIFFPVVKGGDFLFTESNGENMFCDAYNNNHSSLQEGRGHITYKFTLNEDGKTYRITHEEYAPKTLDGGACYLGWDGVTLGESNVPKLAYLDPESVAYKDVLDEEGEPTGEQVEVAPYIDWAFIPKYLYAAYEAKVKLYDALNEAEDSGVEMDDVVAVYNNPAATAEEVEAAMQLLTERLMNQGGSEVDVTNTYIKNADCANTEGWSGFNTQSSHYEGEEGAVIDGQFFEKWVSGAALTDATLVQTITVPAGKYRLQADVIASWQSDGDVEVEGVTLYADGDAGRVESDPIYTGDRVPQTISIEFTSTGATKIGLQIKNTNANWVAVDNFKLYFLGYIDNPNELALLQTLKKLTDYEDEDVYFSAATKVETSDMKSKCEGGKGGSEDEMAALVEEAKTLIEKVEKEIAAYDKLAKFIDQVSEDAQIYGNYGELGDWLGSYTDELNDAHDDGSLSVEEIEEAIASYTQKVIDGVYAYLKTGDVPEGTDVSVLIKNPNMDEGDHWVNTNGNPQIPGWNPESTSPWGYDQSAGEFWNMDFDFYQDIEDLPAGKYTVSFQGFYRWGDPGSVADEWLNDPTDQSRLTAVLYGNSVETIFKSICDGRVSDVEGWSATCGQDDEGNTYYIPNSMQQAQWVFTNHPELYHTEATAVVGPDGHLRIGIKGGSNIGNRWVIFDSFRLRYDGASADLFYEEMEKQANALAMKRDNSLIEHSLPQDISDEVDAVVAKAATLVEGGASSEDCLAYFEEVQAASAKIDAANAIIQSMLNDFAYYDNATLEEWWPTNLVGADFGNVIDVVATISAGENSDCAWATMADLEAMAKNINAYYVSDVFKGAPADVSGENKYDMTVVIRNPQLQDSSVTDDDLSEVSNGLDQWNGGGSAKNQWGLSEFWNANFDINQTIVALPAGYYVLSCDGFYRWGSSDDAAAQHVAKDEYLAAQLYAVQGENTWTAPLMAIGAGSEVQLEGINGTVLEKVVPVSEDSEETVTLYVPNDQTSARGYINAGRYRGNSLVFQSDGSDVKIGLKKDSLKSNDWTIFDNFQLFYVGQEAPVGVGSVAASTGKAVQQAIFTVGGVQVARPQRGVNIVVTTLSDGTKVTSKVLVK